MHLALLHDGRPALLRVEGRVGAPAALFFHPFPLHADAWEEMPAACASARLCAAAPVVGCSMGGYVARAFAGGFPQRMKAAVLMATKASADTQEARRNRERQA